MQLDLATAALMPKLSFECRQQYGSAVRLAEVLPFSADALIFFPARELCRIWGASQIAIEVEAACVPPPP